MSANCQLVEEVAAGRFREDLFYRFAVAIAVIYLPPLREREGDAGLLPLAQDIAQGIDMTATIDRVARHYLEQAIRLTGGNKTRAARLLGFGNPTTLTNWLKRHGVEA